MSTAADVISAVCLLTGALLALIAAVGVLRIGLPAVPRPGVPPEPFGGVSPREPPGTPRTSTASLAA